MAYKGIIFDLDGTLLDTLDTLAYYCNSTLQEYGFAPYERDAYRYMVGDGAKTLVHRMLAGRDGDTSEMFEKAYKTYIDAYNKDTLYLTKIYPGILDLLEGLREKNIKISVLSNKPHEATVPVLEHFFGAETFSVMRGGMEGVPLKPNPAAALDIAEKMGISPSECLYAGDTSVDMQTGKNAGFYTIGVLWGFRDREELAESGADSIVEEPTDILKYL